MKKTTKLKLSDILNIYATLSRLLNKEFEEFDQGYWFSRWFSKPLKKLTEEAQNIQTGIRALVRKHGTESKEKKGEFEVTEQSKNWKKYNIEYKEYMDRNVELIFEQEFTALGKLKKMGFKFTPVEFEAIMPFVDEDLT